MFSQLTITSCRIFFTYFSTWNTPIQWNQLSQEIEITKNKLQLLRSRLISAFQLTYTLFVFIRLYQSYFYYRISMNNFILQIPQLLVIIGSISADLTLCFHSDGIVFVFNQMARNYTLFGEKDLVKGWDVLGLVTGYFTILGPIWSCIFGCFFFFNRHNNSFLYSVVQISVQSDIERITTFLIFLCIEMFSAHCACNTVITCYFVVCSYFVHSSYWLNWSKEKQSRPAKYRKFQTLYIHTSRFNEAFSNTFLVPVKELLSVGFVFCTSSLIRYHGSLEFESFLMWGCFAPATFVSLTAIYFPTGLVWKYSTKFKKNVLKNDSLENRRRNYLRPFGIMISSFYVVKGYTFLSLTQILLRYIFRLLVALKV